jgi:hypothetical protein
MAPVLGSCRQRIEKLDFQNKKVNWFKLVNLATRGQRYKTFLRR